MQYFDTYLLPNHGDGKLRPYDHAIGLLNACLKNTQAGIQEFDVDLDDDPHEYSGEIIDALRSKVDELKREESSIGAAISLLEIVNNAHCRPLPQFPRMINEHNNENQTTTEPTEKS